MLGLIMVFCTQASNTAFVPYAPMVMQNMEKYLGAVLKVVAAMMYPMTAMHIGQMM